MGFALNLAQKAGRFSRAASSRALGAVTGTLSGARRLVGGAVRIGSTIEKAVKKANDFTGGALDKAVDFVPGARTAVAVASRALSGARTAQRALDTASSVAERVGKRAVSAIDRGSRTVEGAVGAAENFVNEQRAKRQRT